MPKTLSIISKKILITMVIILFAVSAGLLTFPAKIYGEVVLVTKITVTSAGGVFTVASGGTLQMNASVLPEGADNKTVTWSIENLTGTATININTGLLTGTSAGTVNAIASSADDSGKSGILEITVIEPVLVSSITVTGTAGAATIVNGGTLQMTAAILPADSTSQQLTWSVTPGTGAATIDPGTGLLTGTGTGSVTVSATSEDGSTVFGTLEIMITDAPPSIPAPVDTPVFSAGPGAQGAGPASSSCLAVYEKTIEGFVTMFYDRILGRAPDEEGFNGWVGGLKSGYLTGADLVYGFIFSAENLKLTTDDTNEEFISSLYYLIFNRASDPDGLQGWMAAMSDNMTKEKVAGHFVSSVEFKNLCSEYGVRP